MPYFLGMPRSLWGVISRQDRVCAPKPTPEIDSLRKWKWIMVQVMFLYHKWRSSYALTMISPPPSCALEITPAWYELIYLRCNFETVSSLWTRTNLRNGFYMQNIIRNGPGTYSVAQIAVELHSFLVRSFKEFSRDFMEEVQNYKELLGGWKYFQVLPKKLPRYNLNFDLAFFLDNIPRYILKIYWRSFFTKNIPRWPTYTTSTEMFFTPPIVTIHSHELPRWNIIYRIIHAQHPNLGGMDVDVQY